MIRIGVYFERGVRIISVCKVNTHVRLAAHILILVGMNGMAGLHHRNILGAVGPTARGIQARGMKPRAVGLSVGALRVVLGLVFLCIGFL